MLASGKVLFLLRKRAVHIFFGVVVLFVLFFHNQSNDSEGIIHEISDFKDTKLVETGLVDIESTHLTDEEKRILKDKEEEKEKHREEIEEPDPCTIINPLTSQFYDLRGLSAITLDDGRLQSQAWNAKGFDYGRNFSIGVCSTPLKHLDSLTNLDFVNSNNNSLVGGYYTNSEGNKVSIGEYSSNLKFRGLNLVLEYSNGDKCDNYPDLNKSTLLTFKCDREIVSKARVNYLGSMNDCSYFFEVKTIHACATANEESDDAVWGIFLIISLSAIAVYLFAGGMYKIIKKHYADSVQLEQNLV